MFHIEDSPVDPTLVFFLGDKGVNWLSEDCGGTFKPLNNGRKIHDFVFHPTQRNWALASIYTTCEDFDDESDCEIYKEVYYSKDLGVHWDFLVDHVKQFSWTKQDSYDWAMHENSILVVKELSKQRQRMNHWSAKN